MSGVDHTSQSSGGMLFVPTLEMRLCLWKKWFENASVQKIFQTSTTKTFHSTRE
jgi:hypothetical protein